MTTVTLKLWPTGEPSKALDALIDGDQLKGYGYFIRRDDYMPRYVIHVYKDGVLPEEEKSVMDNLTDIANRAGLSYSFFIEEG